MGELPQHTGQWQHLSNPPIVEAIFDIHYRLNEEFDIQSIRQTATEKLKSKYPTIQDQTEAQFTFTMPVSDTLDPQGKRQFVGIRGFNFVSEDKSGIIQIRRDGFSLNRLRPYKSFDAHLEEMITEWTWLSKELPIAEMIRISARMINVMQIPLHEIEQVDSYFTLLPRIPLEIHAEVAGLLTQLRLRFDVPGVEAMVILTHQPIANDHLPMIFDIDIQFNQIGMLSIDELKSKFTTLREYKNRIFFKGTSKELQQKYL